MKSNLFIVSFLLCLCCSSILSIDIIASGDFEYGVPAGTTQVKDGPFPQIEGHWYSNNGGITVAGSGYQGITPNSGNNFLVVDTGIWQFLPSAGLANQVIDVSFWYMSPSGFLIFFNWETIGIGHDSNSFSITPPATGNTWTHYQTSIQLNNNPGNYNELTIVIVSTNSYIDGMSVLGNPCVSNSDYSTAELLTVPSSTSVSTSCLVSRDSFPSGLVLPSAIDASQQSLIWYKVGRISDPIYTLEISTCNSDYDTVVFVLFFGDERGFFLAGYNDDGCGSGSFIDVYVPHFYDAYIAVGTFGGGAGGNLVLDISTVEYVPDQYKINEIGEDLEYVEEKIDFVETEMGLFFQSDYNYDLNIFVETLNLENTVSSDMTSIENYLTQFNSDIVYDFQLIGTTVASQGANMMNAVNTGFSQISASATTVDTNAATTLSAAAQQIIDAASLNLQVQTVQSDASTLSGLVTSASSSATSIAGLLTTDFNNVQTSADANDFINYLASSAATVPVLYRSPRAYNGRLEDVLAYVQTFYASQLALASSNGGSNAGNCPSNDAFCKYFFKTAQGTYNLKITSYNTNFGNSKFTTAFQDLQSAFNALFLT